MSVIAQIKDSWTYCYGSKSHMNLAGKIVIGVPMFPVWLAIVLTLATLDALFGAKFSSQNWTVWNYHEKM